MQFQVQCPVHRYCCGADQHARSSGLDALFLDEGVPGEHLPDLLQPFLEHARRTSIQRCGETNRNPPAPSIQRCGENKMKPPDVKSSIAHGCGRKKVWC
eukprot:3291139-Rhodomonas_salina.1